MCFIEAVEIHSILFPTCISELLRPGSSNSFPDSLEVRDQEGSGNGMCFHAQQTRRNWVTVIILLLCAVAADKQGHGCWEATAVWWWQLDTVLVPVTSFLGHCHERYGGNRYLLNLCADPWITTTCAVFDPIRPSIAASAPNSLEWEVVASLDGGTAGNCWEHSANLLPRGPQGSFLSTKDCKLFLMIHSA